MDRANRAHNDVRGTLVRSVQRLAAGLSHQPVPGGGTVALTHAKVEPMVCEFFPSAERDRVLAALEPSLVFVTSANIDSLFSQRFDGSAWKTANLYMAGLGAPLLTEDAPHLVGFSAEAKGFVSPEYFAEDDPFADLIVHEVAHIFHNCKRATIGLRETDVRRGDGAWQAACGVRKSIRSRVG
jgi:hypothetical protein